MTTIPLRQRLREATEPAHARLHRHPVLSAAATGKIDIDNYRALIARLYGFHRAFEERASRSAAKLGVEQSCARSDLLESDLSALGVSRQMREALPLCAELPRFADMAQALGAFYVVEGSTLGGAQIARALKPVLLPLGGVGLRFFSNDGNSRRGWSDLLARIEALQDDPRQAQAVIESAVLTFELFEQWMGGTAFEDQRREMLDDYCAPSRVAP